MSQHAQAEIDLFKVEQCILIGSQSVRESFQMSELRTSCFAPFDSQLATSFLLVAHQLTLDSSSTHTLTNTEILRNTSASMMLESYMNHLFIIYTSPIQYLFIPYSISTHPLFILFASPIHYIFIIMFLFIYLFVHP